jgi:hypothetical protein
MEQAHMGIQGTMTRDLPIEDAWTALADGLHVHRWFLHVAPVLEKTDRQRWPSDPERTAKRIPLCGTEVTFRAESPYRVSPTFVTQAGQLIETAELGYLVRLGLATVIMSSRPMLIAPDVVRIEPADSPLELAARLLAAAAAGWLRLFALLGPSSRQPTGDLTRWDRAGTDTAEGALGLAVRIRLYEAVLAKPDLPILAVIGTDKVRTKLAGMHVEAEGIRPDVYRAAQSLRLIAQDLLITQFPGPMRFAKYQEGGGPGQG